MSIEWLENSVATVQGPGSLALARICLESYGRKWPMNGPPVSDFYQRNEFLGSISVAAWICLAWGTRLHWLSKQNGK
jgi:hypothetical protein